ncbi:aa3-type cytochrome c oxidase subunit IV [Sphingomonas bacterium]|nr:aa3-type cytochrome c oxidase subunit IV [Sphingomonas bacterium]
MADDKDIQGHADTYAGLISLLFWGGIGVAVIAAMVIWLIAPAAK